MKKLDLTGLSGVFPALPGRAQFWYLLLTCIWNILLQERIGIFLKGWVFSRATVLAYTMPREVISQFNVGPVYVLAPVVLVRLEPIVN